MTQKDKELLMKDLCARLPYRVKYVDLWNPDELPTTLCDINVDVELIMNTDGFSLEIEKCKPYLFPLSSMTEEQKKDIFCNGTFFISNRNELGRFPKHSDDYDYVTIDDYLMIYKKLIKNHFDVNGLIPKGLAIDATALQVY